MKKLFSTFLILLVFLVLVFSKGCCDSIPIHIDSIFQIKWTGTGSGYPELDLEGSGFGDEPGNKVIRVGSHSFGKNVVENWSDEEVVISFINQSNFVYGAPYDINVVENGETISNTIQGFFIKMDILQEGIERAAAGTTFELSGYFSPTQGDKKVKFGTDYAPVFSWSDGKIKIKVPLLPPGAYDVFIEENGQEMSFHIQFEIISS
jgi:hypothetical protein